MLTVIKQSGSSAKILITVVLVLMGVLLSAEHSFSECTPDDCAGEWVNPDLNSLITGNSFCISGGKKYQYWNGHLGGFESCQARIDYYIPSQFPPGSVSCGVDTNPCGEPLSYFTTGENCCVAGDGYWVWECFLPPTSGCDNLPSNCENSDVDCRSNDLDNAGPPEPDPNCNN